MPDRLGVIPRLSFDGGAFPDGNVAARLAVATADASAAVVDSVAAIEALAAGRRDLRHAADDDANARPVEAAADA